MSEQRLGRLRELLLNEFNEEELAELCRDIGLNYARLPGAGVYGKTRELLEAARVRHLIRPLMMRVRDLRPAAYQAARIVTLEPEATELEAPPLPPTDRRRSRPAATRPAATGRRTSWLVLVAVVIAVALLALVALPALPTLLALMPNAAVPTGTDIAAVMRATATSLNASGAANAPTQTPAPTQTLAPTQASEFAQTPASTQPAPPSQTPAPSPTVRAPIRATTPVSALQATAIIATATSVPTATPTQEPAAVTSPARAATVLSATLTVSETHPAAQFVHALNAGLIDFYAGKANAEDIRPAWGGGTFQAVLNYAYNRLKAKVGVDLAQGEVLQATLRYVRPPALVRASGNIAQVVAREYWTYTNPRTSLSVCETRDYTYTMLKTRDSYEVRDFRGDLVEVRCEE